VKTQTKKAKAQPKVADPFAAFEQPYIVTRADGEKNGTLSRFLVLDAEKVIHNDVILYYAHLLRKYGQEEVAEAIEKMAADYGENWPLAKSANPDAAEPAAYNPGATC
jgi:hypothetical protein